MKNYLTKNEKILWFDRPKKSAYIFGASVKLFPIAILWLFIDLGILITLITQVIPSEPSILFFIIPFFALHLMPVWIWVASMVKASTDHKYLEYCLTNERLIIKKDKSGLEYTNIFVENIKAVECKYSLFDKKFGVGDIIITTNEAKIYCVFDCENYASLFKILNTASTNKQFMKGEKYCEYCGTKILDGTTTCVSCGATIKKQF